MQVVSEFKVIDGQVNCKDETEQAVKRFLWLALAGTAALALMLYAEGRRRLRQEAKRFDEICPEPPPEQDDPSA
jgi:hypothetical protein